LAYKFLGTPLMPATLKDFVSYRYTVSSNHHEIPHKAQAVYGDDPWQAGYRLIAYTLGVPVGSIVSITIISRMKIPPIYHLFFNTALQTLDVSLMQTISVSGQVPGQLHFFEVMVAFGVGGSFALLIVLNSLCIEPKYIGTYEHFFRGCNKNTSKNFLIMFLHETF
jgi:hypothetical protein